MKFENKISVDGIAVLTVAVSAAIWLGNLDAKVNALGAGAELSRQHIEKLSDNEARLSASLAGIAVQVNTIDKKNPPVIP